MKQENTITKKEAISWLMNKKDLYKPLEILSVKERAKVNGDVAVSIAWKRRRVNFTAEIKTRTAPKMIGESLWRLKNQADKKDLLLVVPFLSKTIVGMLEQEGLSGIDLNGNYLIQSSEILAVRLDQANRFRESQPIKKIFSGNSSLVGRLFMSSKRRFDSVNEVYNAIRNLGGNLSLSAVSKVLTGLENELMIEKSEKGISLIQPEKLLQRLLEDYRPPKIVATLPIKLPEALKNFGKMISPPTQWALTGESSAGRYAVTTPVTVSTIYTAGFGPLEKYEDERFYNVVLKKTSDSFPYFDAQESDGIKWSSPIQCYLELSKLDKRERELAASVRQSILEKLK